MTTMQDFLRGGVTEQFPTGAFTIYWLRERKTGARRGCSPQWVGFDERDRQNLHEISRRWNAYPRLVEVLRSMNHMGGDERGGYCICPRNDGSAPDDKHASGCADIRALLRELGEST